MGFVWAPPPSRIAARLDAFAGKVEGAIHDLAKSHASRAEGTMKAGAPWNDHTEHARQGLFSTAEGTDIILGGTMDYQVKYLEPGTEKMAPRPIIVPTMHTAAPEYFSDAGELVMALLGGA